jgi:hypothetical protein
MIRQLHAFARQHAGVGPYLRMPGDGRVAPVVPASALLWALLVAYVMRDGAFHAVEALVRSRARRALGLRQGFGDDTVAYFTERLDVRATRAALVTAVRQAKRRRGFDAVTAIGLVLDGTTVGRCPTVRCRWCHPIVVPATTETGAPRAVGTVVGQHHKLSLLTVVGGVLVLPVDLEPYGPGDSELGASLRVLDRGVAALGPRFAQYVVADGLYANGPSSTPWATGGYTPSSGSRPICPRSSPRRRRALSRPHRRTRSTITATAWRSGTPTILIPGSTSAGRVSGCCAIARPTRTARSSRRTG